MPYTTIFVCVLVLIAFVLLINYLKNGRETGIVSLGTLLQTIVFSIIISAVIAFLVHGCIKMNIRNSPYEDNWIRK